jgi:5-formyltetrahydrofolate cyclo-ligase
MTSAPLSDRKTRLRQRLRAARTGLGAAQRKRLDTAINRSVASLAEHLAVRCIAAYLEFDGEPCLRPVLGQLRDRGITIALPVIHPEKIAAMEFRTWSHGAKLLPNRHGIPEPVSGALQPLANCDLVLAPLVAWDRQGNRLGMGGGYYDHALAALPAAGGPLCAGVGYGFQEVPEVPCGTGDQRLQAVVNERGWFIIDATDRNGRSGDGHQ